LVSPNFLERIEPYYLGLVQTLETEFTQAIGDLKEFLNFLIELTDLSQLFSKDTLKIRAVFSGKEGLELLVVTMDSYEEIDHETREEHRTQYQKKNDTLEQGGGEDSQEGKHGNSVKALLETVSRFWLIVKGYGAFGLGEVVWRSGEKMVWYRYNLLCRNIRV
jgi:hypothetical protein